MSLFARMSKIAEQLRKGLHPMQERQDGMPEVVEKRARVPVFDKTRRHRATLLLDMQSTIWGNRSIVVRNEAMTPRQAAESVDPDTELAGINFWYFSHPDTKESLAISDLVANPALRQCVMDAENSSATPESITRDTSPARDTTPVFGYHKGHSLEAKLALEYVEQGNVRNMPSVCFQGEWLYTMRAAQKAILSVDPTFNGKVTGVAFWHVVDPSDGTEHPIRKIAAKGWDSTDERLRRRILAQQ